MGALRTVSEVSEPRASSLLLLITRTLRALKGMVLAEGTESDDPVQTIKDSYAKGGPKDGDEFLKPIIVGGDERRMKGSYTPRDLLDDLC